MNPRSPTPSAQLAAFLSRFPPETVALAKRTLLRLRRTLPGSTQIVYDYTKSVVVAFSMSDRGYEAIVALAVEPSRVRLYLDKSLPDPKGLLEGAGTKVRSVTLEAASDLDHADIKALIRAAIKHAGATLPRSGKSRMIIKSGSKTRKPGKAGRA